MRTSRAILLLFIAFAPALQAFCGQKTLKHDIEESIKGKLLISKVALGGMSYSQYSTYPWEVDTEFYPATGEVKHRVEMGHGYVDEAKVMQPYRAGTLFRVTKVDTKDDRVEFTLSPGEERKSAKLKLMLGTGWQTQLRSDEVLRHLSIVLTDQQEHESLQGSTNVRGSNGNAGALETKPIQSNNKTAALRAVSDSIYASMQRQEEQKSDYYDKAVADYTRYGDKLSPGIRAQYDKLQSAIQDFNNRCAGVPAKRSIIVTPGLDDQPYGPRPSQSGSDQCDWDRKAVFQQKAAVARGIESAVYEVQSQEKRAEEQRMLDAKILWCEGQPENAPIDPAADFGNPNDFCSDITCWGALANARSCSDLLTWVDRNKPEGTNRAFLKRAAETNELARRRLDEAVEADKKGEIAEAKRRKRWAVTLKRHATTATMLRVGQTQQQVKAILSSEGFDVFSYLDDRFRQSGEVAPGPWICQRLVGQELPPGLHMVQCLAYREGVQEFGFWFSVSQTYRDPDTGQLYDVKTDKLTQIFDQLKNESNR